MSEASIRIRSLNKSFRVQRSLRDLLRAPRARDVRVALEDIDLEVERGEFFGVLGENGAGKTTLFKILATLIHPDSGSASVMGRDLEREPHRVREVLVPVIPAERSLYWRVSAEENLRLYATLYGLRGADARERVREVLGVVGLGDVGGKQVGLFSSGMKQRLLIARALLGRPQVILLDEPTRSLDPISARAFRRFLREEIGERQGTTVLLATHDHEEVTELCDRVAVLDHGRLLAVGTTEMLLASSRSRLCSIWTPSAHHPALRACVERFGGRVLASEDAAIGGDVEWHRVRVEVAADEATTAELLQQLVRAGVPVSRFTRDDLSLADLIERVKRTSGDGAHAMVGVA